MDIQQAISSSNEKGCDYWCEFFGFALFATAAFGFGVAIF